MEDNRAGGNAHGSDEGPLRRLESWVWGLQRFVDVVIIIGAQALAHAVYPEPWSDQTTTVTVIALLVFGLAAEVKGLYRPWRTGTILGESRDALLAWLMVPMALFAFWFFTKTASHYSRVASFAWSSARGYPGVHRERGALDQNFRDHALAGAQACWRL